MANNYLTAEQVKGLINNRPPNLTAEAIMQGLIQRGYKIQGLNDQPQQQKPAGGLAGFSTGVGKGVLSTIKGAGQLGEKILSPVSSLLGIKKPSTYSEENLQKSKVGKLLTNETLTPQNTTEKVGFGTEKVAEFALPSGSIVRGQKALDIALEGKGILKAGARILSKSALEGGTSAGVNLIQTGGDAKKALTTGLVSGGLKAGFSTLGEVANKFKIPERLYSTIFKNSYRDMADELKSMGTTNFQKSNPERFKELVDSGIIKVDKEGKVFVNETLAKQALDRGLKGSVNNMANQTVKGLYESESKAQEIAKGFKNKISIPESKKLSGLLDEISTDYKNIGGSFSSEAKKLATAIKNNKVDASTGLKLKRFLDGLRIRSSFNPGQKLSQSQQNLKYFADAVRNQLYKIDGFKNVMKDYSFHIEALEALAKEAQRRGNRQILGLIDSSLVGGGIIASNPIIGASAALLRKATTSARGLTRGAQVIKNLGTSTKRGITTRAILGKSLSD